MTNVATLALTIAITVVVSHVASAQTAPNDPNIAALEKQIAGKEQQPVETVFANIQILKGMPAIRVLRVMEQAFAPNLGVTCQHCHVEGN